MIKKPNKKWDIAWKVAFFALVVYFPLFLHLENLPIRLWDEARLAVNAFEMYKGSHFLVREFQGQPDMWNTKPPLMIWLQTLFFHVVGPSELAVRLPAALAALGTCVTILAFSLYYLRSYWFGLVAVLILVTSNGYIELHAARTGDYDSLLTLFTTAYCLAVFLYLQTRSLKFLHLFFLALVLAVLTKGIQAMLFLPAISMLFFVKKEHLSIFKTKWLYIDILLFLGIIAGYYLIREQVNPGYLEAVWQNELGGRYASTLEGHDHDFGYYYRLLTTDHFRYWIWLLPVGVLTFFISRNRKLRHTILFCLWLSLTYWLIISLSATKLAWYDVPIIPLLALICAAPLYEGLVAGIQSQTANRWRDAVLPILILAFVFAYPYSYIFNKVYDPSPADSDHELFHLGHYLKDPATSPEIKEDLHIAYSPGGGPEMGHVLFYKYVLGEKGCQIEFVDWTKLALGETVAANQGGVKEYIEQNYEVSVLDNYYTVKVYRVNGTRTNPS